MKTFKEYTKVEHIDEKIKTSGMGKLQLEDPSQGKLNLAIKPNGDILISINREKYTASGDDAKALKSVLK